MQLLRIAGGESIGMRAYLQTQIAVVFLPAEGRIGKGDDALGLRGNLRRERMRTQTGQTRNFRDTRSGFWSRVGEAKAASGNLTETRSGREWTYGDGDDRERSGNERAIGWADVPSGVGDGHDAVFLLGICDGAERHPGAAPEVDF